MDNQQPDFLKLSPERIAENEAADAVLRQKLNTRVKMSPFEQERARALLMEDEQRQTVKSLSKVARLAKTIASEGVGGSFAGSIDEATEQLSITKRALAESLASQGKFLDAARTTTDNDERKEYRRIAKAVWSEEEEFCKCKPPESVVGNSKLTLPTFRIVRRVFSIKESTELNLLACVVCGKYFVGALPEDLQRVEKARAASTDEKPISDVEIFGEK